ncbi:MAG: AAA family ATPase [Theionarchaea archaeon]|nr:AAA family ATPase [Theionarchaea archaeon]
MRVLITSTKKKAGKTMIGLGIGLHHPGPVGFFKPLGTNIVRGMDEDVLLFTEIFNLEEDPHMVNLSQDYHRILHDLDSGPSLTSQLTGRFAHLSTGKDFMIIETAHTLTYGSYTGLNAPQIARALECPGIVVAQGAPETIIDKSIMARHCFEDIEAPFCGVIVNKSPGFSSAHEAQLTGRGIPVLGVIPEIKELQTPTCEDIIDALDGELLAGEKGLCKKAENTIVGAMTYDTAQRTLQTMKFPHNAVLVTGGDRADMQLIAFELKSSLLVLTGNTYPSMTILAQADELHIPVVMVPHDTMTAAMRCEEVSARITSSHVPLIKTLIKTHVDLDAVWKAVQ